MLKASTKDVLILCFVILLVLFAAWFIGIRKAHAEDWKVPQSKTFRPALIDKDGNEVIFDAEMYDATTDPEIKQDECKARQQTRQNEITFDCPDIPPGGTVKGRIIIGEEEELTPEQKQFKEDREKYPDADCFQEINGRVYPCKQEKPPKQEHPRYAPDKIGVTYFEGVTEKQKKEYIDNYKLKKEKQMFEIPNSDSLTTTNETKPSDPEELCKLIKQSYSSIIRSCDPAWYSKLQGSFIPRDPDWNRQKIYLKAINAPQMWDYYQYTPGIINWRGAPGWKPPTYGLIGSGFRKGNHDYNDANVIGGCDFWASLTTCKPAIDPAYDCHECSVAYIIGAIKNNGLGIAGIYSDGKVVQERACNNGTCNVDAIVQAIYHCVSLGCSIINMSLEVYGDYTPLRIAIQYAVAHNVLVIAAAGNEGYNLAYQPVWPAVYIEVMTVTGLDNNDRVIPLGDYHGYRFAANYGKNISMSVRCLDVWAYENEDHYTVAQLEGTSYCAPIVTAIALVLKDHCPMSTAQWIRQTIERTAIPISGCPVFMCGYGRPDGYKAIKTACTKTWI